MVDWAVRVWNVVSVEQIRRKHFTFLVELLEWGRTFSGFLGEENSGKQGFTNRKIRG